MPNTRNTIILGFVGALVVAFLARTLWFYHGIYAGPRVPESTPQSIESLSETYDTTADVDGQGRLVIFDEGHSNGYAEEEMTVFTGRLAASGAQVEFVGDLVDRLHAADALVLITPSSAYSIEELRAIQQFVDKGGRLVMVGDPTRVYGVDGLNSVASIFGVIYQEDYIYNLAENDGGFQNVIFSDFAGDSALTEGLGRVVFQTAHSLRASEEVALITGDDQTYSSRNEQPGGVIAAALAGGGNALFLPDMTFMVSPYNTFADNDHLLDNVVTFTIDHDRLFDLEDFPYFFDTPTQVVYQDQGTLNDTFGDSIALRQALANTGTPASLSDELDLESPTVYVATYDDADEEILDLLDEQGVTFEGGEIVIEDTATLDENDTVLFHLVQPVQPEDDEEADTEVVEAAPYHLIVLTDNEDTISTGIELLLDGALDDCLVTSITAVCQTGEMEETPRSDEEEIPPGGTNGQGGIGNFLVVADDYSAGDPDSTSGPTMVELLTSLGHTAILATTVDEGFISASDMAGFDAVFWSSGDYSPGEEAVDALMEYLDQGGRLFIDGGSIAFNWSGSEFLESYLQAEYAGFGDQVDLEVGDPHPLSAGFPDAVTLVQTGILPDVVEPLGGATVVFVRGPESEYPGEACLIAYDEDARRVAYATFPVYFLAEQDLTILLLNAANWFLAP